jgi:hypothetical protein
MMIPKARFLATAGKKWLWVKTYQLLTHSHEENPL